mgnify:CR=1 FL=1
MKKTQKMIAIACLGITSAFCGAIGMGLSHRETIAQAEESAAVTAVTFDINGVSLREVTGGYDEAVRFRIQMDKSAFDNLAEGTTYGAKFLPKKLLGNELLAESTNEEIKEIAIPADNWEIATADGSDQEVMESTVYVQKINPAYYGSQVVVVAYYKDASGTATYSAQKSCSLAQVALSSGIENLESYYTFKYNYYTSSEEGSAPIQSGEAIYGDKLSAPENVEKEGYTLSWTNKSGTSVWDFETNTVVGATNLFAKYDLIVPETLTDEELKLVDKTQAVDYTSWFSNASEWEKYFNLEWKVGNVTVDSGDWGNVAEGLQTLTVTATSKYEEDTTFTAYTGTVDVYDASPEFVTDENALIASDLAKWDDGNATTSVESEKYNGKTVVKGSGTKATFGMTVNPLHSANYYSDLLAKANTDGKEYYLVYSYKIVSSTTFARFDYLGGEHAAASWTVNTWYDETIKLSDLVGCIDDMRYSHINANKFKGVETRRNGLLVGVYNNYAATQIYVTVPELVVATTLETVEGGVKLLEKSSGNLNLGELFDTSAYTQEFNFTWKVDGSEITSVNQSAYEEGLHTLELTAKNKLNGLEATAYRATLDIYDENTFTLVKSLNDVIGAKSFAGIWAKNIENIYDTVFEDRNVLKMTSKGQSRLAVLANLAHSYEYYEILVKSGEKSGKNYNISIECYIPSTANETNWTSTYNHKGVETNRANSLKGIWKEDQWITLTISLSDFLGQVKEMQGNYADAVSHFVASASGNPTYTYGTSKTTGQFFGFYLPDGGDAFTMYMTMPTLSLAE